MGDCNIRISISARLQKTWSNYGGTGTTTAPSSTTVIHRLASDATLADVLELEIGQSIPLHGLLLQESGAKLWDCTYFPPKDITTTALQDFPEKSGPKSLTLYDAGWFPSGTLVLTCPDEDGPPRQSPSNYDDVQYNVQLPSQITESPTSTNTTAGSAGNVQLQHYTGPVRPSQVLQAVTTRFDRDVVQSEDEARMNRHIQRQNRIVREQQRQAKLEARLRALDAQKTTSAVATQVQRMLITSRATGQPNLAQTDRVYLRVIREQEGDDNDSDTAAVATEDYVYVSRQDVVGKVVSQSQWSTAPAGQQAELLVKDREGTYRRLPPLLRIYEAVDAGILASFDRVVLRFFDPLVDEPTPNVDTTPVPVVLNKDGDKDNNSPVEPGPTKVSKIDDTTVDTTTTPEGCFVDEGLTQALAAAAATTKKSKSTSTKSSSSAVTKVRQMQMKSKAKGDTKRVKMTDRIFFEVVVATRKKNVVSVIHSAAPFFWAPTDPLQRLVKDGWVKIATTKQDHVQFLKPMTTAPGDTAPQSYHRIADPSLTVQQLGTQGILSNFDRIILYYDDSSS